MQDRPAPFDHQRKLAGLLVAHDNFAVSCEMGTGKSRALLRAWLYRDAKSIEAGRQHVDLVVLAPKGCYLNWLTFPPPKGLDPEPGELDKWLTADERKTTQASYWVPGSRMSKRHHDVLRALLATTGRRRFFVMNVEALNKPGAARDFLEAFMKGRKVMLVIDESTCIMHHDSGRTRWINATLRLRATARVIMSGLIAPESPLNLFSQFYFLDPTILGFDFFRFRNRYAITQKIDYRPKAKRDEEARLGKKSRAAVVVVGFRSGALAELKRRIEPHTYRVLLDDVVDVPRSYSYRDVELTEEQHEAYAKMRDLATVQLTKEAYVTASMAAHQLALLHHIICGHARAEDGSLVDVPSNRVTEVLELLQDHSGKAILFAPYPRLLEKLTEALRTAYGEASTVRYWGEVGMLERQEARTRIQQDPATRFIVSNQSVGGKGGTWTGARLVLFVANSWDQEDRQQSEFRARRIGQLEHVHYVDFRARGTIDERLIRTLKDKREMAAELQGDRWREWLT